MLSVDDYVQNFKSELEKGKTLDELFELIGQRFVVRDKELRDARQATVFQNDIIKLLEKES